MTNLNKLNNKYSQKAMKKLKIYNSIIFKFKINKKIKIYYKTL